MAGSLEQVGSRKDSAEGEVVTDCFAEAANPSASLALREPDGALFEAALRLRVHDVFNEQVQRLRVLIPQEVPSDSKNSLPFDALLGSGKGHLQAVEVVRITQRHGGQERGVLGVGDLVVCQKSAELKRQ